MDSLLSFKLLLRADTDKRNAILFLKTIKTGNVKLTFISRSRTEYSKKFAALINSVDENKTIPKIRNLYAMNGIQHDTS